ncbi:MAG: alpha/beta hydrolase domain-containing protein [Hyphomicrobiales bacterium]|nr:alpha/beta hydrolase domain-containing protein [Hyphomicrobiales bacterium]
MIVSSRTALAAGLLACTSLVPAEAKITRIEITKTEAAFEGKSFGAAGPYEKLTGKAHGALDPKAPGNRVIQDIELAPRNPQGLVEYTTDIEIIRPKDQAKANGTLLVEVVNRGNKLALRNHNADMPADAADLNALKSSGDGFLMNEGYTIVWFGWQADLAAGNNRVRLQAPVARNPDGSPVTGIVRSEIVVSAPARSLPLSAGWFTSTTHTAYPTVSTDNRTALADGFRPTLTVRAKESAPRVAIPDTEWSFATCAEGQPQTASDRNVCLNGGFQPGRLYELIYRANDPIVLGVGFAALRDVGSFFRHERRDDVGNANPLWRQGQKAIVIGTSQSGRMIRSYLHLGFNRDEKGRVAFEGAMPHIGGGLMPMNVRFGHPGRAWGDQIDHLYQAYDFPFHYAAMLDPITGRRQGILDRCNANGTCPKLFHVATSLEIFEGRQSLGLTDPLGRRDVPDPQNVRTFILASTQHSPANLPLPTAAPFGNCVQQSNPNPHTWAMRALLTELRDWVKDGKAPPASVTPKIADGTLVAPNQVRVPAIPENAYGNVPRPALRHIANHNPLQVFDFGPRYRAGDSSGIIDVEPPKPGTQSYGILAPQADADGMDLGGVKSVYQQAPIGSYMAWNVGRKERFEDGFCIFQGAFIPFARTKAEREQTRDPRASIEERYPTREAYTAAVRRATENLVAQRTLLPADAAFLVRQAESEGIRLGP